MKKYYIDNGKIRTTKNIVTRKYIYSKNSMWRNNIGTVYKTKESAIRSYIRNLYDQLQGIDNQKIQLDKDSKNVHKIIRKWEKMI